jgi:hypothetical protein
MIRYSGHPYIDVGAAVLELRLHKPVEEFSDADLRCPQCGEAVFGAARGAPKKRGLKPE